MISPSSSNACGAFSLSHLTSIYSMRFVRVRISSFAISLSKFRSFFDSLRLICSVSAIELVSDFYINNLTKISQWVTVGYKYIQG